MPVGGGSVINGVPGPSSFNIRMPNLILALNFLMEQINTLKLRKF